MGYTLPKIPIFNRITTIPEEKKIHVKRPQHDIELPPWVEVPEDCYVASCRMQDYRNSHAAVVVFHKKPGSFEWGRGYAKVYVYDDNNVNLFPQMKGIIEEIRKRKLNHCGTSYDISEDGEIREYMTRDIPSEETVYKAAMSMMELHERWRDYPNIDNFETIEKLEKAKEAIRRMNIEEEYGHAKGKIEEIRNSIKEQQEKIVEIERNLNSMYEEAADAMNLLEENGIDPNHFDDKPEEEVKPTVEQLQHMVDCLNNRLGGMPGDSIRYIGIADIKKLGNGSTIVQPMNITANPEAGDIVLDPKTGHTAVLDSYGNWQVVSS
jgi:predicted  nucleic acid-binding Zn-ribbon protein